MAQLLDVMPLVPPHAGALPILHWETHMVRGALLQFLARAALSLPSACPGTDMQCAAPCLGSCSRPSPRCRSSCTSMHLSLPQCWDQGRGQRSGACYCMMHSPVPGLC